MLPVFAASARQLDEVSHDALLVWLQATAPLSEQVVPEMSQVAAGRSPGLVVPQAGP